MTSPSEDRDDTRAEATALLADMRAGLEAANEQLDRTADELTGARDRLDLLETVVDVLLKEIEAVVIVVDADRHILGMSGPAIERFDGPAIGKPLTSVVPEPLDDAARVHELPGDAMVLVVPADA